MSDNTKISIRFLDAREVRAIWDEQINKWWFSLLDIVAVLTSQGDYTKTRNYWKYLKTKLKKENNELVSGTNQLKLMAADGNISKGEKVSGTVNDTVKLKAINEETVFELIKSEEGLSAPEISERVGKSLRI